MEPTRDEAGTDRDRLAAVTEKKAALGIRLRTGVAAHCIDMFLSDDGQLVFIIPAFGGKVVGEIMIPGAEPGRPAVALVKPDYSDRKSVV